MDCQFTEEVSLLVDGELAPHEAARLSAHIEGCAGCRQAREAFLLLRQELRAYDPAPDPHTQSRALAAILNSRASAVETAAVSPRVTGWRWSERLAEAFGVSRLRFAHVATLGLLLIAGVLCVLWLRSEHAPSRTPHSGADTLANVNSAPVQAQDGVKSSENSVAVHSPTVHPAKRPKPSRPAVSASKPPAARRGLEGLRRDLPQETARDSETLWQPSTASAVALYAVGSLRAAADPALRVGRHAERVERLLRSFRNARLNESDPTLDVAEARRLSKRLLYNNIALRREAASAGDLPVEELLDSVEPILVDISNLPDAPSAGAVGSIKERIRRRRLVGALQAQGILASR